MRRENEQKLCGVCEWKDKEEASKVVYLYQDPVHSDCDQGWQTKNEKKNQKIVVIFCIRRLSQFLSYSK